MANERTKCGRESLVLKEREVVVKREQNMNLFGRKRKRRREKSEREAKRSKHSMPTLPRVIGLNALGRLRMMSLSHPILSYPIDVFSVIKLRKPYLKPSLRYPTDCV